MSGIGLMTEPEAQAYIWQRVDSREWWLIPWLSDLAGWFCEHVEARHYTGAAAADFELVVGSVTVPAVALAHKRRLRPRALARLAVECGCTQYGVGEMTRALRTQDVLIIPPEARDAAALAYFEAGVVAWHNWVMAGKPQGSPPPAGRAG